MIELLANGLSLTADVAGLWSWVSGFAVDRNLREIRASIQRLEDIHEQIRLGPSHHCAIVEHLAPKLADFLHHDAIAQRKVAQAAFDEVVNKISSHLTQHTQTLLAAAREEMRSVLESVRISRGNRLQAPPALLATISRDPFGAGMARVLEISAGGLESLDRRILLTPQFVPVAWQDVRTNRQFIGEMPHSFLRQHGLSVPTMQYVHAMDGHIYSEHHGLYVPLTIHAFK